MDRIPTDLPLILLPNRQGIGKGGGPTRDSGRMGGGAQRDGGSERAV